MRGLKKQILNLKMYRHRLRSTVSPILDSQMRQLAFKKHINAITNIRSDIDKSQPPPVGRLISYQKRMEQQRMTEKMIEQENVRIIQETRQRRSRSTISNSKQKSPQEDNSNAWIKELNKLNDPKFITSRPVTHQTNSNEYDFSKRTELFDSNNTHYSEIYDVVIHEDEKKSTKHYPRKTASRNSHLEKAVARQMQEEYEETHPYTSETNDGQEDQYYQNPHHEEYQSVQEKQHTNSAKTKQKTMTQGRHHHPMIHETFPEETPQDDQVFPTETKNFKQRQEKISFDGKAMSQPIYYSKPLLVNLEEEDEEEQSSMDPEIKKMLRQKF